MPHNQNHVEMDQTRLCTSYGFSMVGEIRKVTEQQRQSSSYISLPLKGTTVMSTAIHSLKTEQNSTSKGGKREKKKEIKSLKNSKQKSPQTNRKKRLNCKSKIGPWLEKTQSKHFWLVRAQKAAISLKHTAI